MTGSNLATRTMKKFQLILLGDSDISRWPIELLPSWSGVQRTGATVVNSDDDEVCNVQVHGCSGATLEQVVVDQFLPVIVDSAIGRRGEEMNTRVVILCCAGENDVGNGIDVETSLRAFDALLENDQSYHHLIFLGPKFEPWLDDDIDSRRHYIKLSKGFRRRCDGRKNVTFCDCLTMFCGETATLPGAMLGGRAQADPKFFRNDQLHLNEEGYRIWKHVVEQELAKVMSADI
jgi:lysophospholipase L1-like esterase